MEHIVIVMRPRPVCIDKFRVCHFACTFYRFCVTDMMTNVFLTTTNDDTAHAIISQF